MRMNINVEEPLLKENTEKDIENPEKNLLTLMICHIQNKTKQI